MTDLVNSPVYAGDSGSDMSVSSVCSVCTADLTDFLEMGVTIFRQVRQALLRR